MYYFGFSYLFDTSVLFGMEIMLVLESLACNLMILFRVPEMVENVI